MENVSAPRRTFFKTTHFWLLLLVLAFGIVVRLYPTPSSSIVGFDETYYVKYVQMIDAVGVTNYPSIVEEYITHLGTMPFSVLPPMRFLYIFAGYLWQSATGGSPLSALHYVSCLFSILTLPLVYLFTRRLTDLRTALGMLALMVCSPLAIYSSQHALSDGFFAFWAVLCLWLLWENLQRPDSGIWLAAFVASIALMVMTKENAFFAYAGLCAVVLTNRWLKFGNVNKSLVVALLIGPLIGVLGLITLAGGIAPILTLYSLFVKKSVAIPYAIATGDGPWFRYLMDLLLVSPIVLLAAVGSVFQLAREKKPQLFLTIFIASSYVLMCNVNHGMNLRYAMMWDLGLRILAFAQLSCLCEHFGRRKHLVLAFAIVLICAVDLRQYYVFFVENKTYELVSAGLLHDLLILK
jgi:4-amino-4-deoxy-L-arabinose transferase-like glycosyltransferase